MMSIKIVRLHLLPAKLTSIMISFKAFNAKLSPAISLKVFFIPFSPLCHDQKSPFLKDFFGACSSLSKKLRILFDCFVSPSRPVYSST